MIEKIGYMKPKDLNSEQSIAQPCRFCDDPPNDNGKGAVKQTSTAPDGTALFAHTECESDPFAFMQNFRHIPPTPIEPPFLTSLGDVLKVEHMTYASPEVSPMTSVEATNMEDGVGVPAPTPKAKPPQPGKFIPPHQ